MKKNNKIFLKKGFLILVIFILLFTIPIFTKASKNSIKEESFNILNIGSFGENLQVPKIDKVIPPKRDLEKYKGKKLIAFTFDDGPNSNTTNLLLDGLAKYDARVTFFIEGTRIAKNKEVLKKAYLSGHDIGSHTYNHKNLFRLKKENIVNEIKKGNSAIEAITGETPIYLRPPYGNVNKKINDLTDMYIICWDIDTLDWKYKDRNRIKNNIVNHAHDGAIVLLHDIYKESVEGAFLAMEELEKEGYAFVSISEMVELKGLNLKKDDVYYHF